MPNTDSSRIFTYAAHKGPYLSTVGAFLFICLAEEIPIALLIQHFLPNPLLQTLILALSGLSIILMFGKLLFPLWTHHRVSPITLELRYGLGFRASIPRTAIISALAIQEHVGPIPQPHYDAKKDYFSLAFATTGQVLLRLEKPCTFRFGLRGTCSTEQVLMSVDQREAFLKLLALPENVFPAIARGKVKKIGLLN